MELLTLTSQQVADQLHTSRNFIYKLKKYGLLEGIQKGRETIYSTKEVQAKELAERTGGDIFCICYRRI